MTRAHRQQTSLVHRIVAAIAVPFGVALVVVVAAISFIEWRFSRQDLVESARARARITAANCTPSLAFGALEDAYEILSALETDPQVTAATLYDRDGAVFASYGKGATPPPLEQASSGSSHEFGEEGLGVYEPVQQNELWLGTLFVQFDLSPLYRRLQGFMLTGASIGVAAFGVAFALAYFQQGSISRPILALAEVARAVSRGENYSIRAPQRIGDYKEAQALTESFNAMLDRIQTQDATLRESETQFRRAISNAPIPIAIHDESGSILELSKGWLECSGFAIDDIPNLFAWIQERCSVEAYERTRAAVNAPAPTTETIDLGEIEVADLQGVTRLWHANVTPIGRFRASKNVWLLLAIDLTDRIRASQALEERTRELERSNQELDDFAYIASHDMKEPLRGIHNNAMFLHEDYRDKFDEEGVRRLNRIQYLCKRLETLIDDLLYYSRIGRQDLAIQKIDPNKMVEDIVQMLDGSPVAENARIVTLGPLPPCVCDSVHVQEVFRNLISNALKYNAAKDKLVEVGYLRERDGHRDVYFVRDNGYGIDPQFHRDIFRIFKRLNPESDETKGTGSGLTFVKKIVERHSGSVWVDSQPGRGSTFYFTLRGDDAA